MKNFYNKGISIVELLIVFAVLAVIFSVVIPQFSKIREQQVLKGAVGDILSSLNKAQSQTLASLNSSEYGVHFESGAVIIFKGTVFSDISPDNEIIKIISPAFIFDVTLGGVSGDYGDIFFNHISGVPNKTGTVTVSTSSFSKIITISFTGSASAN